ncbi:MAG: hypothetical protein GXP29_06795, partial [Planctomycetes bacterium]|nr:hypothetical protein [Planctomycetota bacterium]
ALEPETAYYYYEYHYLLAATIRSMTGDRISIPFVFGLTSGILAIVIVRLVFWMSLRLMGSVHGALLSAACVSVLGGWDIVPVMLRMLGGASMPVILDSWCPVAWRIHNLMTQFYWCPQHVAALCALLLASYWLTLAPSGRFWLIVGPFLGASVFGASVYIAMPVFIAAALYCLHRVVCINKPRGPLVASVLVIAVVGALLMIKQAMGYQEMGNRFDGGLTFQWDRFPLAVLGKWFASGPFANLLDAWWLTLIDFGLPAVALVLVTGAFWKQMWNDPGMRLLLICGGVGFVAMFSMRSSINPIDYGFRVAIMPTMIAAAVFAGALMSADTVRRVFRKPRRAIVAVGVILSLPVGLFEAPMSAGRTLIRASSDRSDAGAYRFLRDKTPRSAIVQAAPTSERVTLPQIIHRQIGASDPDNWHVRVFWPPNPEFLREAVSLAESAFNTTDAKIAHTALQTLGVTHLLLGPVEEERYGKTPQFADETYFEKVYEDKTASVYRLRILPGEAEHG